MYIFQVDFSGQSISSLRLEGSAGGQMVARLLGFLHPPADWQELLNVCISYCNATLRLTNSLLANVSAHQRECSAIKWPENITLDRVPVDFEARKTVSIAAYNNRHDEYSKMELQHQRDGDDSKKVNKTLLRNV